MTARTTYLRRRLAAFTGMTLVALVLGACSEDGTTSVQVPTESTISDMASPTDPIATSPPTTSADRDIPEAGLPQTEVLNVTIEVAENTLQQAEVALGSPVKIRVRSAVEDEFHLHGYDLELTGTDVQFSFTADRLGEFLLESHSTGQQLFILTVVGD
ncbi:MAG: hypothetical protein RLZ37_2237 [Actinomycetota bacterium]|jgi:hypothetical protein